MRPVTLVALFLDAAVLCALSSGCATMIKGTTQSVFISSKPQGAAVRLRGDVVGYTPCKVLVPRSSRMTTIYLQKEGYLEEAVNFHPEMNWWIFGNFLSGGFIGVIVDAITGAAWGYEDPPPEGYVLSRSPAATVTADS